MYGVEGCHGIWRLSQEVYWSWSVKCEVTDLAPWRCPNQFSFKRSIRMSMVNELPSSAAPKDPSRFHKKPHVTPRSLCLLLIRIRLLLHDRDLPNRQPLLLFWISSWPQTFLELYWSSSYKLLFFLLFLHRYLTCIAVKKSLSWFCWSSPT